ncbi:unnamed protein product [Effrenium voratum]|nr:unnamed protein product [Effrenium voratum]
MDVGSPPGGRVAVPDRWVRQAQWPDWQHPANQVPYMAQGVQQDLPRNLSMDQLRLRQHVAPYQPGHHIAYWCRSRQTWTLGYVLRVLPQGPIQISCRPHWVSVAEQHALLRRVRHTELTPVPVAAAPISAPTPDRAALLDLPRVGDFVRFHWRGDWTRCTVQSTGPGDTVQISWQPSGEPYRYTARVRLQLLRADQIEDVEVQELRQLGQRLQEATRENPIPDHKIPQALDALALPGLRTPFRFGLRSLKKFLGCGRTPEHQVAVRIQSANLEGLRAALERIGAHTPGLVCNVKVGPPARLRAGKVRSKHTEAAEGGLRPTWRGGDIVYKEDASELALCVHICAGYNSFGLVKQSTLLAVAEMEIPPGRHCHRLQLFSTLDSTQPSSGPLILSLETTRLQVHRGIKCASCRVSPIVGDRFKCLDCRNADLCADCYAVRASVHAKHELVLVDNVDVQRSSRPMSQPFLSARCFPPSEPGHVSQEACMRELAGDDAFIPLSRTSNVSFGLDCVPDDENPSNLLVEHIRAGSAAAAWNQEGALSGGNFMLVGDELRSVNDIEGSEAMLLELGQALEVVLRIARPTRRARAVLEVTGSDTQAALDILMGDCAVSALHLNSKPEACTICADLHARGGALRLRPCGHGWFCKGCLQQWAAVQLGEGRSSIHCPVPDCRHPIGHRQLQAVLSVSDFGRFVRRSVENLCLADESFIACPTPDCPYRAWIGDDDLSRLICEICHMESCIRCGTSPFHHGLSCEEEARRQTLLTSGLQRLVPRVQSCLRQALFRNCPGCAVPIERQDACCHMTCSHCSTEFSWVCGCLYDICRTAHNCMSGSIYLHEILAPELRLRHLPETDQNASDLFLELRAAHLLAQVRAEVGDLTWETLRQQHPDLLQNVIRGARSIPWDNTAVLARLQIALPHAFP